MSETAKSQAATFADNIGEDRLETGFTMRHNKPLIQIISQPPSDRQQYGSEEVPPCM